MIVWLPTDKAATVPKTEIQILPLKYQVMLGAGAPSALQDIVASLPSSAVRFAGGWMRMGTEAAQ